MSPSPDPAAGGAVAAARLLVMSFRETARCSLLLGGLLEGYPVPPEDLEVSEMRMRFEQVALTEAARARWWR